LDRKVNKSEEEWRQELTPEQYHILREKGTERPFTGEFVHNKKTGMYTCGGCGAELFASDVKFDSGTGWPSFTQPVEEGKIELKPDNSFFMRRTEVLCGACGGHLGHVFNDGPAPTGLRYCINSCALGFEEKAAS
jgi:peptide-methionine (R)-S-oxide reductase